MLLLNAPEHACSDCSSVFCLEFSFFFPSLGLVFPLLHACLVVVGLLSDMK
jgi:hypothetical protein